MKTKPITNEWPFSPAQMATGFIPAQEKDPLLLFAQAVFLPENPGLSGSVVHQQLYGIKALSLSAAAISFRIRSIQVGVGGSLFGFDLFHEQQLIAGIAKSFRNNFRFGLNLKLQQVFIKNYGEANAWLCSIGWKYKWRSRLQFYGIWENVTQSRFIQREPRLPEILQLGCRYQLRKEIALLAGWSKEMTNEAEQRFGVAISVVPAVRLRFGFTQTPNRFTGGVTLSFSTFQVHYAFCSHPVLGYSHSAGLTFFRL